VISPVLATAISQRSGTRLCPASPESVALLKELGLTGSVVDFYGRYEPAECAEIDDVRLWPIAEVVAENRDYVPGANLIGHGLIVVATTVFGDAYCIDSVEDGSPVVLMSHDVDYEGMHASAIKSARKLIAPNFDAFLEMFVAGTLDLSPLDNSAR